MKTVFIYTFMHTGSVFLRKFLETAYGPDRTITMPKYRSRLTRQQKKDSSHFSSYRSFVSEVLSKFSQREKRNAKALLLAAHQSQKSESLLKELELNKPRVPFVITVRDPLLVLNTYAWRHPKSYGNSKEGTKELVSRMLRRMTRAYSLPNNKAFLYPIDILQAKTLIPTLFNYCNLPLTLSARDFAKRWKPVNTTRSNGYSVSKTAIRNKDMIYIRKHFSLELDLLQRQTKLKKQLYKIGYRNLAWW